MKHSQQQTNHPIVVQKYGGSSLADIDCLKRVAHLIHKRHGQGEQLCVVVSAMGNTTDHLLAQARDVSTNPSPRELDMLLTCGERMSMALLAMALTDLQIPCISFTGSQSGILTDSVHTAANIVDIRPVRVQHELAQGKVVIIAGFQGVSPAKEITTLRRGGSDTTAVGLAAALGARCCEIYSDVAGVYTADPRLVSTARLLQRIDAESMHELASHGTRVLNAQAVALARDHGVTIHARKTGSDQQGTVIEQADRRTSTPPDTKDSSSQSCAVQGKIIALAHQDHLLSFVVSGSCRLEQTLHALANQGLHIVHVGTGGDLAGKNAKVLIVTLPHPTRKPSDTDLALPEGLKRGPDLAAVSWVSYGRIAESLQPALTVLQEHGLPVYTVFCSGTRANVFVKPTIMRQALQLLHERLVDI